MQNNNQVVAANNQDQTLQQKMNRSNIERTRMFFSVVTGSGCGIAGMRGLNGLAVFLLALLMHINYVDSKLNSLLPRRDAARGNKQEKKKRKKRRANNNAGGWFNFGNNDDAGDDEPDVWSEVYGVSRFHFLLQSVFSGFPTFVLFWVLLHGLVRVLPALH